jgi:hypothetical protein
MKKIVQGILLTTMAGLIYACAVVTPPIVVPPVPPTPVVKAMHVVIRDSEGNIPGNIRGVIGTPTASSVCVPLSFYMLNCDLPTGVDYGNTISMKFEGDGSDPYLAEGPAVRDLNVELPPSYKALPRIHAAGKQLRAGDQRFAVIESTDFNLLGKFAAGSVEDVLAQRANLGYNTLRVFTGYNVVNIGRFVPSEHGDFCELLQNLAKHASRYNLYVEYVGFTGEYTGIFANDDQKVAHWETLKRCLADSTNVLLELANEWDHPANHDVPWDRMTRPAAPIFASHGSPVIDGSIPSPWDYITLHYAEPRKVAHNAMEDGADRYGVPAVTNESQRFPDNDNQPYHAYDMARGCVLLSGGCAYHSVEGKTSSLFTGVGLTAATEFARGAHSLDLRCQDGGYVHRTDLETPAIVRAYERPVAGLDCVSTIRN